MFKYVARKASIKFGEIFVLEGAGQIRRSEFRQEDSQRGGGMVDGQGHKEVTRYVEAKINRQKYYPSEKRRKKE